MKQNARWPQIVQIFMGINQNIMHGIKELWPLNSVFKSKQIFKLNFQFLVKIAKISGEGMMNGKLGDTVNRNTVNREMTVVEYT